MRCDLCLTAAVLTVLAMPALGVSQDPVKARTYSGQQVLLYPDGTWKPVVEAIDRENWQGLEDIRTVTLLSRRKYDDYEKATFSFVHGVRDDPGLKITHNDWDLLFGNGDADAFDVTMVSDDRSRIKDLGKMSWPDLTEVPLLPAYPMPTREKTMKAVVGHVYEIHVKDDDSDLYALCRVEWLEPGDSCVISWVVVPAPEEK